MHRLLRQQIEKYLADVPTDTQPWSAFFEAVSTAYKTSDAERELLERSLVLSSDELRQANGEMRAVFQAIPDLLFRLDEDGAILDLKAGKTEDLIRTPRELIGKRIQSIPDRTIATGFGSAIARLQAGEDAVAFEYSLSIGQAQCFYEARMIPLMGDQIVVLVQNITSRKRAEANLADAHRRLLEGSRLAGMAEVATGVIHNIGNVLNSINVSGHVIRDALQASRIDKLTKATEMLETLWLPAVGDKRGRTLVSYLCKLAEVLVEERTAVLDELNRLTVGVEHIRQIVHRQQKYARHSSTFRERHRPAALIEEALSINRTSHEDDYIEVVREIADVGEVHLDKHKTLQILVNLISNARRALEAAAIEKRTMTLRLSRPDHGRLRFEVADNGVGISPENRERLFTHGFTTRTHGHGFGLHASANAAREMGGSLTAWSDGPGRGATFTLDVSIPGEGPQLAGG